MQPAFILKINKERLITFGIYVSLFLFLLFPYSDYDWGWHFKYGEYFLSTWQIMWEDVWSWTTPGYKWVNHEWLYDPLLYVLSKTIGFTGLSIVGALVGLATFHISLRGIKLGFVEKALLAFFFAFFISSALFQGLRSQVIGLLFLAVNLYLIRKCLYERTRAYLILPIFYLLFVNFHGSFVLGLALLGLSVMQSMLNHSKMHGGTFVFDRYTIRFALFSLLSVAATFLNPFTYHVYLEALRHFHNPLLQYVMEWIPVDLFSGYFWVMVMYFVALIIVLMVKIIRSNFKHIDFYVLISSIVMIYLSFTARRYVPIMMVVTLPFLSYYLSKFPIKFSTYKAAPLIMVVAILIALQIGIHNRITTKNLFSYGILEYCNTGSQCSEKALSYLKKNPPKGRGFNFYDWGGWMIGREFPAKLYIDGRMHLWKDEKGFQPMEQYTKMYYGKDMDLFNSYDFDWVFIPKGKFLDIMLSEQKENSKYKVAYEDATTVYYVKEE